VDAVKERMASVVRRKKTDKKKEDGEDWDEKPDKNEQGNTLKEEMEKRLKEDCVRTKTKSDKNGVSRKIGDPIFTAEDCGRNCDEEANANLVQNHGKFCWAVQRVMCNWDQMGKEGVFDALKDSTELAEEEKQTANAGDLEKIIGSANGEEGKELVNELDPGYWVGEIDEDAGKFTTDGAGAGGATTHIGTVIFVATVVKDVCAGKLDMGKNACMAILMSSVIILSIIALVFTLVDFSTTASQISISVFSTVFRQLGPPACDAWNEVCKKAGPDGKDKPVAWKMVMTVCLIPSVKAMVSKALKVLSDLFKWIGISCTEGVNALASTMDEQDRLGGEKISGCVVGVLVDFVATLLRGIFRILKNFVKTVLTVIIGLPRRIWRVFRNARKVKCCVFARKLKAANDMITEYYEEQYKILEDGDKADEEQCLAEEQAKLLLRCFEPARKVKDTENNWDYVEIWKC